jgi:large subunit ribosomal protein L22
MSDTILTQYKAKQRFADVSARKMRPIASLIRGLNVDEAVESLKFLPNRGARLIEAVVKSAMGNAQDKGCRDVDGLVVTDCRIDGGPTFKRIRPRARGTAFGILRRLSHISVVLSEVAGETPAFDGFDSAAPQMVTPAAPAAGMPDAPQLAAAPVASATEPSPDAVASATEPTPAAATPEEPKTA